MCAEVEVGLTDREFRVLEGDLSASVCSYLRGATERSVVVNATTTPGTAGQAHSLTAHVVMYYVHVHTYV